MSGWPGGTPGGIRRLDSIIGGVHHSSIAHLAPIAGAKRSSNQNDLRTLGATAGSIPDPDSAADGAMLGVSGDGADDGGVSPLVAAVAAS